MLTINKKVENEIIINKSRFIAVLTNINNPNEIEKELSYYKTKYKDATHYITAYIIGSYMKCSDDKEPSGTAGLPALNVLKNNNLTNVLCIVIRYFGGIKLGAGGLVRAYSKAVTEALNKATLSELIDGYYIEIEFDYNNSKIIDNLLKDIEIKKKFDEKITYSFNISKIKYKEIETLIEKNTKIIKKESIQLTV